jgi:flagellar protein FliO/FliZ
VTRAVRAMRCALAGAPLAGAPLATAAAAATVPAAGAAAGFAQVAASLLLIVGVIVALAWLATRLRLTPRAASGGLKVLADVAVGPKERVVLLKVGDAQALVGVGADGIRSLALLDRVVELPAEATPPGAFAERLKGLLAGGARP